MNKTATTEKAPAQDDRLAELDQMIAKAKAAQAIYATYTQEQVDKIFRAAAVAANENRIRLAKMAVAETGMGVVEDKVIKNHFASEYIYHKYKDVKTCGELSYDPSFGLRRVAEPLGIIAGIVPTTNPTSTAIFKCLIALKTRNAIIFSPHPRAKKSTKEAAMVILRAAVEAGAPDNIVECIDEPSVELSSALMRHKDINLILATGGPGMVHAAYSSGTPAVGVGAGNTPAVIDETAEIQMAVSSILMSKTFDNGVICASEQSAVVMDEVYDKVKKEFLARGAYILSKEEKAKVGAIIMKNGRVNPDIVGQPAYKIAALAGLKLDKKVKILIGEAEKIDNTEPFASEKLSPVLALYHAKTFEEATSKAEALIEYGGLGHTSSLYTDMRNTDRIRYYGSKMKTSRVLVNMPSSQGAIGDIFNFKLEPSLTLGCGSWGGNSISENVGVKHLMNVKSIAERRENMLWFKVPPKIYFKYGSLNLALKELTDRKRALVITDESLYNMGFADKVTGVLEEMKMEYEVFFEVKPDPDLSTIHRALELANAFKPDLIIALGGGSAMDASKMTWLLYENPDAKFEEMAMRFMDIRKRIYAFPSLGKKAQMVCIPTTSGTGSEVTPFAVVTDDATGKKYPIADYALTPDMAIIDPELTLNMPKRLTAYGGIDAVVHALEALVSVLSTEFSNSVALESIRLLFKYLPDAYEHGATDPKAREKVHYAATLAGMAFANAFLGVCHSMAHKLGAKFHMAHGLANALLITDVIRYNATDIPLKQTAFPQYQYPTAKSRYARVADYLHLGGKTDDEKVELLIQAIEELKERLNIPGSIREAGISQPAFEAAVDQLAEDAFDDQCTGANPRFPLISELKEILMHSFDHNNKK